MQAELSVASLRGHLDSLVARALINPFLALCLKASDQQAGGTMPPPNKYKLDSYQWSDPHGAHTPTTELFFYCNVKQTELGCALVEGEYDV